MTKSASAKRPLEAKSSKKEDTVDANDPIDVAMGARKAAGSAEAVIKEPEAKKRKL